MDNAWFIKETLQLLNCLVKIVRGNHYICTLFLCDQRFPLLVPILDPVEVVDKVMHAVLTNQRMLMLPRTLGFLLYLKG